MPLILAAFQAGAGRDLCLFSTRGSVGNIPTPVWRPPECACPAIVYLCKEQANLACSSWKRLQGPGSLARNVRERKVGAAEEYQESCNPNALSGARKQPSKQHAETRKASHRPSKPAWVSSIDVLEQQTQPEPSAATAGRHAGTDAGSATMLRRCSQHHTTQDMQPTHSSQTQDKCRTGADAGEQRAGRLQTLRQLHGASEPDTPVPDYPAAQRGGVPQDINAQDARAGKGNARNGPSEGLCTASGARDESSGKAHRAGAVWEHKDASRDSPDVLETIHDSSRGRSSTPIDRLRRLQRTRTSSNQPRMEGMHGSPNSTPASYAVPNNSATMRATEGSHRLSNNEKKLARTDHGTRAARSTQREHSDAPRTENHTAGVHLNPMHGSYMALQQDHCFCMELDRSRCVLGHTPIHAAPACDGLSSQHPEMDSREFISWLLEERTCLVPFPHVVRIHTQQQNEACITIPPSMNLRNSAELC